MSEPHADPDAGRMAGDDAPAAPNQQKTEPIPPSPASATSASSGSAGDAAGVSVPSEQPAEGTSERMAPVEGVAFAPEGLADGETDVAMPSTTTF